MREPKEQNKKKRLDVRIVVGLMGCSAIICAALIGIFPEVIKLVFTIQPTSTATAYTISPPPNPGPQPGVEPTDTKPPPLTGTPPPIPVLTDTPPGTILKEGDIWRQNGAEIILKNVEPKNYGGQYGIDGAVNFELYFTNHKPQNITLSYHYAIDNSITAVDNLGRSLKIWNYYVGLPGDPCDKQTIVVPANDTVNLSCGQGFIAQVDIGDSNVREIFVTVSGISTINNAQWVIPIGH